MGWQNPPLPWSEMERRLSGRRQAPPGPDDHWAPADGGDSPAWSRKRLEYEAPRIERIEGGPAYAELHCHSHFSFLDGASSPEELVEEAARLGLRALALTDHNGFYGVVRFSEAAREVGVPTIFGSELSIRIDSKDADSRRSSRTIPETHHLVVLARDPVGYALLGRAISRAQMAGEKGAPRLTLEELSEIGADRGGGHWQVLTGCHRGSVPGALVSDGPAAARREIDKLVDAFGRDFISVELWDHSDPLDSVRNDGLAEVAISAGVDLVATNNVHYHAPVRRRLATAVAAVAARASLDEIEGHLPAAATAHLRSGAEQSRRFLRYPGVVERASELGLECVFDLELVAPDLPPFPCGEGHDEMSWLRHIVSEGAVRRYGTPGDERVPGAWQQIEHELEIIERLNFPGYFLIVWDIVEFCRRSDILCQGRGSAANSAVCYALGITNADAVSLGLLFERFLSAARDGPPDIDIDIESGRREEVIQYVYDRYGRENAAQVCNVITYRARSAVRDMAKALGYATGQQDAFAKAIDRWGGLGEQVSRVDTSEEVSPAPTSRPAPEPRRSGPDLPLDVLELALDLEHSPRHLGIHSGGMVLCDRPVVEVCPVEWARMEDRSVLQWDKDDCAAAGLVKFDLLGLGMLTAIHEAIDLIEAHYGTEIDIATLPQDPAVYDMMCKADTIGVFQIESRAQMATLPRLKPRCFYDLVVEVALIRPGPIQGGSVHPYIRRRNGEEPVTYLHPLLEPALAKTLGIPLFQEQLMQMAIDVAGFSAAEADQLRQAMGSKRSQERMGRLRSRLYEGMAERGITGEVADVIWDKLAAFANFGFPESHSVSFAYLVYISAWLKHHYPAAFCAALLNAQPMGFYSPHSLVQDARRHGVTVLGPSINESAARSTLVATSDGTVTTSDGTVTTSDGTVATSDGTVATSDGTVATSDGTVAAGDDTATTGDGTVTTSYSAERAGDDTARGPMVRLGLEYVRHVGEELAREIEAGQPYSSIEDLRRRLDLKKNVLESLATAGAFDEYGIDRRQAIWQAGALAHAGSERLEGIVTGTVAPQLPGMSDQELAAADFWSTSIAVDGHPTVFVREQLDKLGVVSAESLLDHPAERVLVGGVVTHRQRPATAGGTTFLNLEDETGLINVVVSKGCWIRHRKAAAGESALLVRGRLEKNEGVVNVIAEAIRPMKVPTSVPSRDFR